VLASLVGVPATAAAEAEAPFRFDLYRAGDFVSQTNVYQCVGASMQMMLNLVSPSANRTVARQLELQTIARSFRRNGGFGNQSSGAANTAPGPTREPRGASSRGWAYGLGLAGLGRYHVTTRATLQEAINHAAVQMRLTGRPVGILVWRGRHAWVVTGFEATADPRTNPDAQVTHVWVLDPFYPRSSSTWGRMAPHTKLSLTQLSKDWVEWRRTPRWAMVVPLPDVRPMDRRQSVL
jgi:hypothetical protein